MHDAAIIAVVRRNAEYLTGPTFRANPPALIAAAGHTTESSPLTLAVTKILPEVVPASSDRW